jgi:hypothetical protein
VLKLPDVLSLIQDSRKLPQIATPVIVKSALDMFLGRLRSLNALEQLKKSLAVRAFLGAELPSADTIGRVFALIDPDTIRRVNHEMYARMKRNKALELPTHGLVALIIDGHESHATYRRRCRGCLERTKNKDTDSEKTQFYHRHVAAQLVFQNFCLLLDIELQLSGEDERAAAKRLLKRVLQYYPKAFDLVVADALYCCAPFINLVIDSGKDIVVVAKDERYDIVKDAESFLKGSPPSSVTVSAGVEKKCWDVEGFQSWSEVKRPLRVVKTKETKTIRRQLTKEDELQISSWMWITTLSTIRARTEVVAEIGHDRWKIENNGFNQMVNAWFSDHVYKHDPAAMLNFWLLCVLAYNLFHCFYFRNLKEIVRQRHTMLHIAREIQSALYCWPVLMAHPP